MKVKFFAILILFLSFSVSRAEIIDRIIAKVDDGIITLYDLNKIRASIRAYSDVIDDYEKLETKQEKDLFLLDLLINDLLIEKEMEVNGISASDEEIKKAIEDIASQNGMDYGEFIKKVLEQGLSEKDYNEMIKKQIKKMKYYSRFVNSKVTVTDKEILTFFREKKDEFAEHKKVGFTHVLFLENGDKEKARKLAGEFLKSYKETSSVRDSSDRILEKESVKISSNVSLKISELAKEFREPVTKLEPGEAAGIIENDNGFNIIILKEIEVMSLDSLKDRIADKIKIEKRNKVYKSMLSKLKQEHSVERRY